MFPEQVDNSHLDREKSIPHSNTVLGTLTEDHQAKLVRIIFRRKVLRVKLFRSFEVILTVTDILSVNLDKGSFRYDNISSGDNIVLYTFALKSRNNCLIAATLRDEHIHIFHFLKLFKANIFAISNNIGNLIVNLLLQIRKNSQLVAND